MVQGLAWDVYKVPGSDSYMSVALKLLYCALAVTMENLFVYMFMCGRVHVWRSEAYVESEDIRGPHSPSTLLFETDSHCPFSPRITGLCRHTLVLHGHWGSRLRSPPTESLPAKSHNVVNHAFYQNKKACLRTDNYHLRRLLTRHFQCGFLMYNICCCLLPFQFLG